MWVSLFTSPTSPTWFIQIDPAAPKRNRKVCMKIASEPKPKPSFPSNSEHRTTIPSWNLRRLTKLKNHSSVKKSFRIFFCFLPQPPLIPNSKNLSCRWINYLQIVHFHFTNSSLFREVNYYSIMEAPQESYGNMPNMLCCLCGVDITYNPASMCTSCLQNEIDITSNLRTTLTIHSCRGCGR